MDKQFDIWLDKLERFCSFQERCISDVEKKMTTLKVDDELKSKLIECLVEAEFLDERRYTLFFIRAKVRIKRDGVQKIKSALFQKKIPGALIQEVLEELDRELYSENVQLLLTKKWAQLVQRNEKQDAKNKLIRYLMGKGYKYDEFNIFLKKLN
jgi:regulatory protein